MRPVTPKMSPPALPAKTMPFQARGARGTDSPFWGSPIETSQTGLPVEASSATMRASPVPRNSLPPSKAIPRLTPRPAAGPGRLYFHFSVHEEARSEEHTSELQSHVNLVCRLLL